LIAAYQLPLFIQHRHANCRCCVLTRISLEFYEMAVKGTVSPDYKGLEVTSIKTPLLGHVTPDIKKILNSPFNF
jgi:hypothetical protein